MGNLMAYDYFYGKESSQFTFIRIPKLFYEEEVYRDMSDPAKILYAVFLDKMSLSSKNNWIDEDGRTYIKFKVSTIMTTLNWSKSKVERAIATLVEYGLIEKKRVGQGDANWIYVKNFARMVIIKEAKKEDTKPQKKVSRENEKSRQEDSKKGNQKSRNDTSESLETILLESTKEGNKKSQSETSCCIESSAPININNNINNNHSSKTDMSYIKSNQINSNKDEEGSDGFDKSAEPSGISIEGLVKSGIYYEDLCVKYKEQRELLDEIVSVIVKTLTERKETITVKSKTLRFEEIEKILWQVDYDIIEYTLERLSVLSTPIHNREHYILITLLNNSKTIDKYYDQMIEEDRSALPRTYWEAKFGKLF